MLIKRESFLDALRRCAACEHGAELIEFAIAGTVLFSFIFGIMMIAELGYAYHFTSYAAREATRYALVRGSTWSGTACSSVPKNCNATSADVLAFVKSIVTPGISPSSTSLSVTTTWPGTTPAGTACSTTNGANSPGCLVKVQVSYSFSYQPPTLPMQTLALKSTSQVVIMQ